jgi:hypothetical protein
MNESGREISELAGLLPVPDGRDLPTARKQILKEHLMTELRQTDAPARPRRPRRRVLIAAGVATAVAVTAVVATNPWSAHTKPAAQPSAKASATPVTTAGLLAKIANAAASQPSPVVRDSEFVYIRSEVAYADNTIVDGHETSTMEKLHERQIWLPVANLCVTGLLIENGQSDLLSPFPVVNGKVDTSPPPGTPRPNFTCPSKGHLGDATYRLLQSLPTEPAALLNYLKAGKKWTNDEPITEIGDLIREAIIPPAVAAALYRVAALLPGATLVPDAVNAVGRHGIGIAWNSRSAKQSYRNEWIFDKTTLQYIGERDYDPTTGQLSGESAILQQAFTAKAGQLP